MGGRLVPELAVGEFEVLIKDLCSCESSSFRIDPTFVQLESGQQTRLLVMFDRGSEALIFYVHMKIGAYNQLPLKLAGMAHPNRSIARRCAETCLQMFLTSADGASHHECQYVLVQLRADVARFLFEGRVGAELKKRFGRYRVMMVNETTLEGLHSTVHRQYLNARNAGSNHIAVSTHLPEIKQALRANAISMESLAAFCDKAIGLFFLYDSVYKFYSSSVGIYLSQFLILRLGRQRWL